MWELTIMERIIFAVISMYGIAVGFLTMIGATVIFYHCAFIGKIGS